MRLSKSLIVLFLLATLSLPIRGEESENGASKTIESPSPDGQFAFLYEVKAEEDQPKTFDLIEKKSGQLLKRVAESDPSLGNRFSAEALWRPDSKAFAVTVMIVRLGTYVTVFVRDGEVFREIKVPELEAEIPAKLTRGKGLNHIASLNSESALRWQKDGSLLVEIVNMVDGNGGSVTATRRVTLGFATGKAKVLKSTIKFVTEES